MGLFVAAFPVGLAWALIQRRTDEVRAVGDLRRGAERLLWRVAPFVVAFRLDWWRASTRELCAG
jgi:hypothetical protein